ncbi:hypothetical protein VTG60DRAFT_1639 [Thermothelomyces hinnuleus]
MPEPVLEKKGNDSGGLDYKAKLDEAADRVKKQPREEQSPGIVAKVSQYVPAVGAMLRGQQKDPDGEPSTAETAPGPPKRPEHDTQIEEFLKDQHGSKKIIGLDEPTQA